ncbi:MAG: hypothetical protein K2Q10_01955 [Rhodospirillales bacterium]|nr:hypothetical protein [Rhodospirillales bacterium]
MKKEIEEQIHRKLGKRRLSFWGKWGVFFGVLGFLWLFLLFKIGQDSGLWATAIISALLLFGGIKLIGKGIGVSAVDAYKDAAVALLGGKADYWYADRFSAIAVSAADGRVGLVEDKGQLGVEIALGAYDTSKITDVQMMRYQSLGSTGSLTGDSQQNIARMQQIARDGGLRVSVADIDTPMYRIRMGERSGERWAEVLNQLIEGTLPPQPQPKRVA